MIFTKCEKIIWVTQVTTYVFWPFVWIYLTLCSEAIRDVDFTQRRFVRHLRWFVNQSAALTARQSLDNGHFSVQSTHIHSHSPHPRDTDAHDRGLDPCAHTHSDFQRERVCLLCPLAHRKQLGPRHLHPQTHTHTQNATVTPPSCLYC